MADVADRERSLVLTHDHGTRLREIIWVALSNDPKRIYTREWVAEARDASPYDAADLDSSEVRIVARDADDAEALEHIDEPVFGSWSGCSAFLVSGDGRWFVTLLETDGWFLCIRDHALGRTTRVEIPGRVISPDVRWVGDGVTVMVGTDHDHVRLFDVRTGDALGDFRGGDLAISEDGALIALRDEECVTLVRHAEVEEVGRWTLSHPSPRRFAAISRSPLGVWCIDADHGAAASHIWWCEPGREPLDLTHLAPRDVIVGATMYSNELALITARGRVVKVRRNREASAVTFDAYELRGRRPGVVGEFVCFGFSPDGRRCAGRIGLVAAHIDLANGDVSARGDGPSSGVAEITASRDARSIGVAWTGGDVAVLDADTLEARWRFEVDDGRLIGCAFAPDGRTLYTLTHCTVHAWDLSTGLEVAQVRLPGRVDSHFRGGRIRVSPAGRHLLIGRCTWQGDGREAWLLVDLVTGALVDTSQDDGWRPEDASFTTDGSIVVLEAPMDWREPKQRAVTRDLRGQRVRPDRLLHEAAGADASAGSMRLQRPALIEDGWALFGLRGETEATYSYLLWNIEEHSVRTLVAPTSALLAHRGGYGLFALERPSMKHCQIVLRDLLTMRECGGVSATLATGHELSAAAIVSDRALFIGLKDSRILRFSIEHV